MSKRITVGAGLSLGALASLPSAAQAEDLTVTNLNDAGAGSLREAVEDANADSDADRILFNSKLSGTIQLEGGFEVVTPVEILGPGSRRLTVAGNGDDTIFDLLAGADVVTISGLRLENGVGIPGGAIAAFGDVDVTISKSVVTGNRSFSLGGGVYAYSGDGNASLTIEDSTISGNSADARGGGIYAYGAAVKITNSTVSGNSTDTSGGGVAVRAYFEPTYLEVRSSTIAANTASNYGGGIVTDYVDVQLRGAIVADNTAGDGADDLAVTSLGGGFEGAFNLVEDGEISGSDNVLGQDPKLKPLKDNGGPTDTHAFKKSPAKNAGPSDAPDKDQRGAPRKGQPDIGAYEFTKCKGVVVNRVGTSGKDKLKGTKKKDGMLGLGGNDKLKGKKGKDGLCGGRGKDKLIGGPGKDKFNGGPGKDKEIQ